MDDKHISESYIRCPVGVKCHGDKIKQCRACGGRGWGLGVALQWEGGLLWVVRECARWDSRSQEEAGDHKRREDLGWCCADRRAGDVWSSKIAVSWSQAGWGQTLEGRGVLSDDRSAGPCGEQGPGSALRPCPTPSPLPSSV